MYKMIKDHRTGVETANIDKVLNGDLDDFIDYRWHHYFSAPYFVSGQSDFVA